MKNFINKFIPQTKDDILVHLFYLVACFWGLYYLYSAHNRAYTVRHNETVEAGKVALQGPITMIYYRLPGKAASFKFVEFVHNGELYNQACTPSKPICNFIRGRQPITFGEDCVVTYYDAYISKSKSEDSEYDFNHDGVILEIACNDFSIKARQEDIDAFFQSYRLKKHINYAYRLFVFLYSCLFIFGVSRIFLNRSTRRLG